MKVIKKGRIKVPFREIVNGDVFYSNDFDDYAMKILPKVHRDVNAVLLTAIWFLFLMMMKLN